MNDSFPNELAKRLGPGTFHVQKLVCTDQNNDVSDKHANLLIHLVGNKDDEQNSFKLVFTVCKYTETTPSMDRDLTTHSGLTPVSSSNEIEVYQTIVDDPYFQQHVKELGLRVNAAKFSSIFANSLHATASTSSLQPPIFAIQLDHTVGILKLQYIREDLFEINGEFKLEKMELDRTIASLVFLQSTNAMAVAQTSSVRYEMEESSEGNPISTNLSSLPSHTKLSTGETDVSVTQSSLDSLQEPKSSLSISPSRHSTVSYSTKRAPPTRATGIRPGARRRIGGGAKFGGGARIG